MMIATVMLSLTGCSNNEGAKEPAVTPELTATPAPTEALKPTTTPEPTATPEPTSTPVPTATPTPTSTPTPKPTNTPVPTSTPVPAPSYHISKLDKEMQAWSFVNVRDYPSKAGNKIGSLNEGDIVTVTGQCEETGWYRIVYLDTDAYVSDGYIVEVGSALLSTFDPEKDVPDLETYPEIIYDRNWSEQEKECLARIVMAEAEGDSLYVKTLIAFSVINRVQSKGQGFPNTIEEVILQHRELDEETSIYQYESARMPDGRYHKVEPNDDCWKAVDIVQSAKYDFSGGAMYYESNSNVDDSWNARNLEFVVEVNGTRFYK